MTSIRCLLALLFASTVTTPCVAGETPAPVEPEVVTLGRPIDFAQDVQPILEANCIACHNIAIDEGDLSLESVQGIHKGGSSGPIVVPGKPDESLLLAVVSHKSETVMPPPENDVEAKPLSPRELGLLRQWIVEGAGKGQAPAGTVIAWRSISGQFQSIGSVDLSPDGRFAAVARGNQVEVYDLPFGTMGGRLIDPNLSSLGEGDHRLYPEGAADRDLVQAVAFDPAGRFLATAGYRSVRLWHRLGLGESTPLEISDVTSTAATTDGGTVVATGREVQHFEKGGSSPVETWIAPSRVVVVAASHSSDVTRIAAACDEGTIIVWQAGGKEPIHHWNAGTPATAVSIDSDRVVTGHGDGTVRVWFGQPDGPHREWKAHENAIATIRISTGDSNVVTTFGHDAVGRVWNLENWLKLRDIMLDASTVAVAIDPHGRIVASAGESGDVTFRSIADGAVVGTYRPGIDERRNRNHAVEQHAWRLQMASAAASRLEAAETALAERETILRTAIEARDAASATVDTARTADQQATMELSAARDQAAAGADDPERKTAVETADAKATETRQKLTDAEDALRSAERSIALARTAVDTVRIQQDERRVEKQAADTALATATVERDALTETLERPVRITALAFTGRGDRAVIATDRGGLETCTTSGAPLDHIRTPGVKRLLTGGAHDVLAVDEAGAVRCLSTAGGWEYAGVLGPPVDAPLDLARSQFVDRVLAIGFSPDGRLLITGGGEPSRTGELQVWNVDDRTLQTTIDGAHSDTVLSVAVSRDGRYLATASADKFAKLFDLETGTLVRVFEGHTNHVTGMAIQADATAVATASADRSVKVWDLHTGEQSKTITGFGKPVTAIRYVGLSDEVATSCGDQFVRRHSSMSGESLQTLSGTVDYVQALAVCPNSDLVAAGGEAGTLFVWDRQTGKLLHRFEANGLTDETAGAPEPKPTARVADRPAP